MSDSEQTPAQGQRSRARLLEFLKFRVLASQEAFFEAWRTQAQPSTEQATLVAPTGRLPPLDLQAFRSWLEPLWPEARRLSDQDLSHALEQAQRLYVDTPSPRRP